MIKKLIASILISNLCIFSFFIQNLEAKKKDCNYNKTKITMQMKTINMGKEKIKEPKIRKRNYDKYKYDEANRIIEIDSIDKGKIKITYDEYGRLKSKNKSNIEFERYYYDILGRKTRIVYEANGKNDKVIFKYSTPPESYKLGHLTEKIEEYEHSFYKWDGQRLLEEKKIINGHKFITKYRYNNKGHLSEIQYPSGLIVLYKYNDKNEIEMISVKNGNKTIDALKTKKEKDSVIMEYGNGLKTEIKSNREKRTVSMKTGNIQDLEFRFNDKGLIDKVKDKKDHKNKKEFFYDQYERLITAYGLWGKIQYRYDDMDNLLLKKENCKKLEAKYFNKSGRIKELKENGKPVDYLYDKLGRTIKYGNMTFTYNERGRLSKIFKNKKLIVELFYNHKGQRSIERRGNKEFYYIYDNKDRVLSHHDNKGKVLKEYVYIKEFPIGFVMDKKTYYYHYDLMNFPVMISNETGKMVREVIYKPYGEIISSEGRLDDTLRFPGQYDISHTNLFYNHYRIYSSILTIYLESDPINNTGNIYRYTSANPIKNIDINGLQEGPKGKNCYFLTLKFFEIGFFIKIKKKIFNIPLSKIWVTGKDIEGYQYLEKPDICKCFIRNNSNKKEELINGMIKGSIYPVGASLIPITWSKLVAKGISAKWPWKYPRIKEFEGDIEYGTVTISKPWLVDIENPAGKFGMVIGNVIIKRRLYTSGSYLSSPDFSFKYGSGKAWVKKDGEYKCCTRWTPTND